MRPPFFLPATTVFHPDLYFQTSHTKIFLREIGSIWNIMVGTDSIPANNFYGVAFTVKYDASLVEPGTENIVYTPGWLGTPGVDAIKLFKADYSNNMVYGAETRINHINSNGFGKIATLRFQAKSSVSSKSAIPFLFSSYAANDFFRIYPYY